MQTPILETERLILRPMSTADAPVVFKWASDERVSRYMIYPNHKDISVTLQWLESIDNSSENDYDFGFVEKDSGELIGSGGVYWESERISGVWATICDLLRGTMVMQPKRRKRWFALPKRNSAPNV